MIAACCAAGAASAGADPEARVELLRSFGEEMGIAFQIKDDLLDFAPSALTGKPTGGDVKERKMTLAAHPYTLQSLGPAAAPRAWSARIKRSKDHPAEDAENASCTASSMGREWPMPRRK